MQTVFKMRGCRACQDALPPPEFTMAFQPVVDLSLRRIDSHEALVRGLNRDPAQAVLAKVNSENRYSFDQACRVKAIELATRMGLDTRLNINFIPNAVYEPRACIRETLEAAARCGLDKSRLTFEIVEGEDFADMPHLKHIMAEYRRQGFLVALDDFGTGYSGLSRLAALQPDIVKLDRALIENCDADPVKRTIIAGIAALCRSLGTRLVAEGVETARELAVVQDAGIRFVQGFHFARPAFERLVTAAEIPFLAGSLAPLEAEGVG
jgi:EAL domain-containing protein (putative c-di-GMP-specific phosphodiesterase class I)